MIKPMLLLGLFLMLGTQLMAAEGAAGRVLLRADFDHETTSSLTRALLAHKHITLAEGAGPDGSNAIRVAYVGYEMGSERVGVRHPLGAIVNQATLSFDVRFDEEFQWTLGGKLHGLGPKNPITGGRERQPDGWSARIMFNQDGHCSTYLYDQDKEKVYGIGRRSAKPVFEPGRWHHVAIQVGLNSPGEADGFSRILIDGEEVVHSDKVMFRGVGGSETQIQALLFSTFHGGNSPRWTPVDAQGNPTTVYALYDNFEVTEGLAK